MRVTLLGPVGVESAGAAVALGGPKQRAVFALLALDVGRVVSLDRLILELWRDEPPAQATMALQSYVSRLRRVLAGVASPGAGSWIVTRPPGWMLDLPPESVDAVEFGALVSQGRDLLASGQPADAADRLRTALALWTGPAMGDLGMDEFAVASRTRLEQLRMDATESLFEAELAAGEPMAVVEAAEHFTQENPFRERGWVALMVGLYRTGRQADALAAAARLRVLLAEELGLDPSPEVSELENRILRHDPLLDGAPRADPWFGTAAGAHPRDRAEDDSAVPSLATTPPRGEQLDHPAELVVGRGDVLAIIDEVLAQAVRGRGRAVLIEGPAGIGKSTVLRAVTERVELGGGTPLRGAGVGGGADAPAFWPWVQILRELNREFPELVDLARNPALASLDPALFEVPPAPDTSDGHDAGLSRTRLYRAVIDLVTSARQQRPIVVVIDDAHWLDDASAHLLRVAVPELTEQGVVFVVGFRSQDSLDIHDALAILGELRRDLVVRLELAGLDLAGVEEVVRRINGSEPHPGVTSAISTRTAGNPLFVGELVRLLISEDRLDPQGAYDALPTEVRDVLRRRLQRLPEAAVDVLVVAALIGRPVDMPLLVRVTGMSDDAVLLACESAALTGLLLDDDERPGCFVLSHDLVRQTLVESVSAARRVRLHARIGEALQVDVALQGDAALAPERVIEVAHHLYLAAPLIGPAAAIPFMFAAADDALGRMATEQAEGILDDTLTLAAGLGRRERSVRGTPGPGTAWCHQGLPPRPGGGGGFRTVGHAGARVAADPGSLRPDGVVGGHAGRGRARRVRAHGHRGSGGATSRPSRCGGGRGAPRAGVGAVRARRVRRCGSRASCGPSPARRHGRDGVLGAVVVRGRRLEPVGDVGALRRR